MASLDHSVRNVSTENVVTLLDKGLAGGKAQHLADFDIGTFPRLSLPSMQEIPRLATATLFHFSQWIHRSNNSDLALVTLQNESDTKILRIVIIFTVCSKEVTDCLIAQERKHLHC